MCQWDLRGASIALVLGGTIITCERAGVEGEGGGGA